MNIRSANLYRHPSKQNQVRRQPYKTDTLITAHNLNNKEYTITAHSVFYALLKVNSSTFEHLLIHLNM